MARSQALKNLFNLIDAANEELSVEQQFLNDLRASIEMNDSKNARKPSQSYKPSSMNCIRNMYFQMIGADCESDRASSELVGICESGTDRHDRIQKAVMAMKENGIDCEYIDVADYVRSHNLTDRLDIVSQQGNETKLYNKEYQMSFLCDGIIRYKGKYYILEIKTETANKFWDRTGVNPAHLNQGTAYSVSFDIDDVLFLYECRDTCNKKAYMLHITDNMKQELVWKILECNGYVERQVPPPKPQDAGTKLCAYCSYSDLCKRCE